MELQVFSIFDRLTGTYGQPMFEVNEASAERRFNYLMSNAAMVAGDCDLYYLGIFDNMTGKSDMLDNPKFICHYEVNNA